MFKSIRNFFNKMIIVNSQSYNGRSVTIINGKVIVDGKDVTPDSKEISIKVEGNLDSLSVDYANTIHVEGSVGSLNSVSGDVECNSVTGDVKTTSGDVDCGPVGGNVQTVSGDVNSSGSISGSVKTVSGDIKNK